MNKREIGSIVFLILSIIAYIIGVIYDIQFLSAWSTEVGGASLVLLGYFLIEELFK